MRALGYVEGENTAHLYFSSQERNLSFEQLAEEVVKSKPDIIVASNNGFVRRLLSATKSIPIVAFVADRVVLSSSDQTD